ncbi:RagB/SusD family nutrient uptake outer membrane protein [Parapedobacter sp. DT-150]|uniref:RagB/SusD family nutrient uptake outer membrane protein n=1 Tax=Parapedobacter sp. DT-150 TaxID=3396162 RepID=UPI003F1CA50B
MKLRQLIFLLLGVVYSSSCNKALDMAPDGKLSIDEVFEDDAKVRAFLNSCYNNMPSKGTLYFFWSRGPVVWSDEAWDTDAEAESGLMAGRMYNGAASAGSHPIANVSAENGNGDYWARYWNGIYNCSVFISHIDNATVIDEQNRPRWKAEAHLLRAYYYSELLKWFGAALPIIREPYQFDADFSGLTKASFYEVVKFIEEDCNVALATEELPYRITSGAEAGRVNKAMAEALKSKMMLFAASPLFNGGQDHWEEAYELNKTALANLRAQGFELYNQVNFPQTYQSETSFFGPDNNEKAALYNEYFTNTMAYSNNPVDKETLYQSRQGQGNIWNIDGIGAQDGYKSGTCPSQEMVDAYETIDGQPILDLENPYLDEKHLEPNYNPSNTVYDPQNPYENRDPRFYASIYYNGSKRKALWNFTESSESPENYPASNGNRTRVIATYIGEPRTGIHESNRFATRTGYFERKFLHPTSGNDNPVSGANWKLFRLGEVILNFAEAAAETGHLDEAKAAVDEIRNRVGMPPLPEGLTQEQLITRVRHERRVELAFEENRYFDVRRWSSPEGDLTQTDRWITAAAITRNTDGTYTYGRRSVRAEGRLCYTNKFLLVPIPLAEANRLLAITGANWQNPGW